MKDSLRLILYVLAGSSLSMSLLILPAQAQNLIPNPRFEQISNCQQVTTIRNPLELASPWFNPNNAPYNDNYLLAIKVCLPANQWVDQDLPFSYGYVSTTSQYQTESGQVTVNQGTYASTPLIQRLESGKYYWFSTQAIIALQTTNGISSQEESSYGLLLSDQRPNFSDQHLLPISANTPQLLFTNRRISEQRTFSNGFSATVAGRQTMQGCLQAKGNEKYMALGDFLSPAYSRRAATLQFTNLSLTKMPDQIDLGPDTSVCQGQPLTLKSKTLMGLYKPTYHWQDGSTDSTLVATQSGLYSLTITCSCRTYTDSIRVEVRKFNWQVRPDTSVCQGNPITLTAGAGFDRYRWSDGSTAPTLQVDKPGVYRVEVEQFNCLLRDSIRVYSSSACCQLYLPNAFTPNGDGLNDQFGIITGCSDVVQALDFIIYNRWGEVLFDTHDTTTHWNGTYQGDWCAAGAYSWKLMYSLPAKQSVVHRVQHGTVLLIR